MLKNICMMLCLAMLCSCFTHNEHQALCEQLKNRIVMNGATGNQRLAQQQRAELGTLDKSYRREGCE